MKQLRALILALAMMASPAVAQQFPVVNDHTVIGRIGTGTGSGPSQAIPFTTLSQQLFGGIAPSHPVIHPSSGNLIGSGCVPAEAHSLWWVDQNLCAYSDSWNWNSSDPSALFTATLSGSVTVGDRINLTFTFGSGACAAGCTVGYTAVTNDTLTKMAQGLVCAIAANPNLFNLNGSTCSSGAVVNTVNGTGGYAGGQIVGYLPQPTSGVFNFDFNSTVPLKLVAAVTGSATETVTITNTNCGIACSNAWDVNPTFIVGRNTGTAPPASSQGFAIVTVGTTSASPAAIKAQYGIIANTIMNSTTGALDAMWTISTPDVNGVINRGLNVRAGAYTVGQPDPGYDAMGASQYWFGSNNNAIYRNGTNFTFHSVPNDNYLFDSTGYASFTGSVGINMIPTGKLDVNGYMGSFGQSGAPTGGSGIIFGGSTSPIIQARTFPAGSWLSTSLLGLSWDFKPSNSATSGWTLSANLFAPDSDNATALGSASLAPSTVFSHGLAFTSSGTADTFVNRFAAANVRFGSATDSATPVAQTLSVQNVLAGTSNTAGASLTIAGSQGTGTGNGGSILLQTSRAGTTGSSQNALTTALTIDGATGSIGVNTAPAGGYRLMLEDGTGNGQFGVRYTGRTGMQFIQNSSGNTQLDLIDNANLTLVTNNGSGGQLQIYGDGGTAIGTTPVDHGANNLYVQGAIACAPPVTKTGTSGTVGNSDCSIIFNASGTYTATLPAASSYSGRWLHVKSIAAQTVNSASSNVVPRAGGAAGTALLASGAGNWADLQSDGTNWIVMSGN